MPFPRNYGPYVDEIGNDPNEGGNIPAQAPAAPPTWETYNPGGPAAPVSTGGGGGGGGGGVGISDRPVFNFPSLPGFTPPQFTRPTVQDAFNEPGYQFRLQSGSDALQRSAAAKGLLRTGGTLKDITEYGQNFASNEYGNVFNRALSAYDRLYQGAKDKYAPQLAQWNMLSQAELQAALAQYQFQHRDNGGSRGPTEPPPKEPDIHDFHANSELWPE
jgi:hypothetical protein